jgi:hypothetical protein
LAAQKQNSILGNVFINCPFDSEYAPIFEAIVFSLMLCGFNAVSAKQRLDSAEVRIDKIVDLIAGSRFSVHDLSRTQPDAATGLPRFKSMPLELGVDIGCRRFSALHRDKTSLIFVAGPHEYQKFISDIAGQDPLDHQNDVDRAIKQLRDWLATESHQPQLPGARRIAPLFRRFRDEMPSIADRLGHDVGQLAYVDFTEMISNWLGVQGTGPEPVE